MMRKSALSRFVFCCAWATDLCFCDSAGEASGCLCFWNNIFLRRNSLNSHFAVDSAGQRSQPLRFLGITFLLSSGRSINAPHRLHTGTALINVTYNGGNVAEKHLRTNFPPQFPDLTIIVSSPRFKRAARANATTPEIFATNILRAAAEATERCSLKRPLTRVFVDYDNGPVRKKAAR